MRRPGPNVVFAVGAALYFVAVIVASLHPGPRTWGLHLVGFLDLPGKALVYGLLVLGVLASAASLFRSKVPESCPPELPSSDIVVTTGAAGPSPTRVRSVGIKLALLIFYGATLWVLRARTHFLGDGMVWIQGLREGKLPRPAEPLSEAVWQVASAGLRQIAAPVESLALVSMTLGIAAAVLCWRIAREITAKRGEFVAAFLLLMTLGIGELFFGYIESYPVLAVAILAYLWVGLRSAKRGGGALLPVLAFAIAVASHLMALYLTPSLLYLILRGEPSRLRRTGLVGLAVILPCAILLVLGSSPDQWVHTLDLATRAARTGAAAVATVRPYGILSLDHLVDIANEVLLVLPIPLLLLLTVVVTGKWSAPRNNPEHTFLVLAAGAGVLGLSVLVLPVAAAQDWDLYSMLLLPAGVLGVWAGRQVYASGGRWIRAGVVGLSLGSLLAFVLVNSSATAGERRYRVLVGPGAKITDFARWYAFESLAHYYRHRGDYALAMGYVDLLLRTQPQNARYWGMGGEVLMGMGHYAEAIPLLEEGVRRDPLRATTRTNLGIAYSALRRYRESLEQFREAVRIDGNRPDYRHNLGLAYINLGEPDSALTVWSDVRRRWPGYGPTARAMTISFGSPGP